jgi:hypothetical protein
LYRRRGRRVECAGAERRLYAGQDVSKLDEEALATECECILASAANQKRIAENIP